MLLKIIDVYFISALAFNAASFQSVWGGGVAFTAIDPVPASVLLAAMWLLLRATSSSARAQGVICILIAALLGWGGVWAHVLRQDMYANAEAYHRTHWRYAVLINAVGFVTSLARAAAPEHRVASGITVLLLVAGTVGRGQVLRPTGPGTGTEVGVCPDAPFFSAELPEARALRHHRPFRRKSQYVAMSDGVELAVDVYLPNNFSGTPLPTFLHLTRYHRAEQRSALTTFVSLFGHPPNADAIFPMRSLHYLNAFVPDGYAFVSVDVRGTGASFGSRPIDLIDREVLDFAEIAAWTKRQAFCNGRIGTGGISYDGIAGALMASQGNIDAAALLFSPGDLYEDIVYVGGIPTTGFVDMYAKFTAASENNTNVNDVDNELPAHFKLISTLGFTGVAPVRGAERRLPAAVAEHRDNFDMTKIRDPGIFAKDSTLITTRDGRNRTSQDIGISERTYDGLVRHGVAVYSFAGYYDSGSVRSAARLHNHLLRRGATSKLTIGPWSHGARACWTPSAGAAATAPQYPLFEDVKRFFDCRLKGQCGPRGARGGVGVADEPALHYFLSGPDEWRTGAGEWPPDGLSVREFPLAMFGVGHGGRATAPTGAGAAGGAAQEVAGARGDSGVVTFAVDFSATSGVVSRWNLVQHLMKRPVTYPDRAVQSVKALVFGVPLPRGLTIVGSPVLVLSLALAGNATDAAVFAYLEEAHPETRQVRYITEAAVRVSHRSTTPEGRGRRVGAFDSVHRTFLASDMKPLAPGVFTRVQLVMEPVAYVVAAHRTLRLVLAGADADNFYLGNIPGLALEWRIATADSQLLIPTRP